MTSDDYKKLSPSLPKLPGVYRYLDEKDKILYVGKAKNLKSRISSYFGNKKHQSHKTKLLIKNAARIEYTVVETEHDAFLLENTLIKKFQPRYNVMLKDGKTYTYICIKKERFPRVFFTRRVTRDGSTYFGPYTSKYRARIILDLVKNIFPLRTCTFFLSYDNIKKGKFKVCLEYHIKNCHGPCEGYESEEEYNRKIAQIKNILRGHFGEVKDFIKEEMRTLSEGLQFEQAQLFKEKLNVFEDYQSKSTVVSTTVKDLDVFHLRDEGDSVFVNYLKVIKGVLINTDTVELKKNLNDNPRELMQFSVQYFREKFNSIAPEIVVPFKITPLEKELQVTIPNRGDKKKLLELADKNLTYFIIQKKKQDLNKKRKQTSAERILKTLQEDLQMDKVPLHIECFDNSNIQGTNPTASCVVFKNSKPSKKDYRHFKIKTVVGANDFASMEEVVGRRYNRLKEEGQDLPQLVIIDGGKGQLSSAVKSLEELDLLDEIVVIGIAKKLEEIFFPGDSIPLYINKKSESLKLIQQLRNEAHRFALKLHRNLRSKNSLGTALTEIPGIGEKTADKLLRHFKSMKKLGKADEGEIAGIVGKSIARKVLVYLNKE